ncbi:MAG: UDP-galactopyranose mutase [Lachnospiraceae bacterium]|nr:UDP-galactopyranose mutase [Lachnospiraceae bacterium]
MYDYIIVGSGFAGATAANILADRHGKKVLIIEKRSHIGGNCYDENDEHGILIHKYGPHIFHTDSEKVYEYLSKFTQWYDYSHEVVAYVDEDFIPVPFNLNTLKIAFPNDAEVLREKLVDIYGYGKKVPILELKNNDDEDIRKIADYVYENIFLRYTMKQWGKTPEEIAPAVTGRVPVLISDDNRYFQDTYQGMPLDGYTKIFENMLLNNENIDIILDTDCKEVLKFTKEGIIYNNELFNGRVIFTGPLDELFDNRFGRLPYRTLNFVNEYLDKDSFQPKAVVNYTVSEDYTRITEYKKLTGQEAKGTSIMKEYPMTYTGEEGQIPYYAIINEDNLAIYNKYLNILSKYNNFYLLGRLAEYKYYNIDAIVLKSMELVEELEN